MKKYVLISISNWLALSSSMAHSAHKYEKFNPADFTGGITGEMVEHKGTTVPPLIGKKIDDKIMLQQLKALGFKLRIKNIKAPSNLPSGIIVRQSPSSLVDVEKPSFIEVEVTVKE